MKPKTIILMVVAVVCGLGASYMTSRLLAERQNQNAEKEIVSVVVAKKDLEIGVSIKDKNVLHLFELTEFEKGKEPPEAMTSLEQLKDRFLRRNLRKGDFVTPMDVVEDFNALELPDGKRAMSVRVTMETGVAGFATLPGSRVDLLWFDRSAGEKQTYCWTLLEDVLVLAADQVSVRTNEKTAIPASVVTLALTPEESRKVNLARETGQLQLVLRRPDDKTKIEQRVTSLIEMRKELQRGFGEEPEPPVVVPEPPKQEEPAQPVITKHRVDITIGDRTRTKEFLVDPTGKVLRPGDEPRVQPQPPVIPQVEPAPQDPLEPPANPGQREDV